MHSSSRVRCGEAATVWRRRIRQQQAGGLSIRAFCRANDCPEALFYYWRVRLGLRPGVAESEHTRDPAAASSRRSPVDGQTPGFARAVLRPEGASSTGRVNGHTGPAAELAIRLRLRGGRELLLPAGMTPMHLAQLVAALEALPDEGDREDQGEAAIRAIRVREDGGAA
jgi:hypothetical protein